MIHRDLSIPLEALRAFCQRNGIRELALFGSATGENFGPESDVDLVVEFQPDVRIGFIAFSRMQRELVELLQRRVDLVPKQGLKPLIRDAVLRQAQVLYAA